MDNVKNHEPWHPEELLPWYVNNTLSPEQRLDVERHLEECSHCQKEFTLLQHLSRQIRATPISPPGELGLRRLLHQVRQEKEERKQTPLIQALGWRPMIAFAAAVIIVVQAGLLMWTPTKPEPITPLSGPTQLGVTLQVTFAPSTTEAEIRESLQAIGGNFISGPSALGVYRIRLTLQPDAHQEIERAIRGLRSREGIITHVARE